MQRRKFKYVSMQRTKHIIREHGKMRKCMRSRKQALYFDNPRFPKQSLDFSLLNAIKENILARRVNDVLQRIQPQVIEWECKMCKIEICNVEGIEG